MEATQKTNPGETTNSTNQLGSILLRRGRVKKFQLDFLLELQAAYKKGDRSYLIGELLVKHRVISTLTLVSALALQKEMPIDSITQVVSKIESDGTVQTTTEPIEVSRTDSIPAPN